ncbi:A/G-specific adenine glycosylase [Alphaproteobacteria bacterium]|nr:A/G-specific adenine glycosylase [Alphaproteobacteria bacterium]
MPKSRAIKTSTTEQQLLAAPLLAWYDKHQRRLPWRARPNTKPNPYHVWLSEIMLQQTNVTTVKPYFDHFTSQWPNFAALAAAPEEAVMTAWAGLGYYARARNLVACARRVSEQYNGQMPKTEDELLTLPGIGPYTAAAISSIAFNRKAAPVDGNIERVISRYFAIHTPLPQLKKELKTSLPAYVPEDRPGDFAQAMMDLGATICTPKRPNCSICPWQENCEAKRLNIAEHLPIRAAKKQRPKRQGRVYWLQSHDGHVLTRTRPKKGLLGGMVEFPSTGWDPENDAPKDIALGQNGRELTNGVRHIFTHFELDLRLEYIELGKPEFAQAQLAFPVDDGFAWHPVQTLFSLALPSVMMKVYRTVVKQMEDRSVPADQAVPKDN